MKIEGIQINVKTGEIKKVTEEISDKEYQKGLEEARKAEEEEKNRKLIEAKKREILERLAKEELIKEGKLK